MPPQPGIFAVSHVSSSSSAHKIRNSTFTSDVSDMGVVYQHHTHGPVAGPSSRIHGGSMDDGRKDKRRKDISGKLGKEIIDRRDDGRHYNETITILHGIAQQLSAKPETHRLYNLRLYPLSLERSAMLSQLEAEEKHAIECAQVAYDEERERVEDEWKRGRERVRERLMEGVEERRRRAREEKEGEGTVGDAALDAHSRPPITRKLRNKLGTSPPPTPLGSATTALTNAAGLISSLPITTGPFLNPHSLSVDELPSPFPLPLTSTSAPNGNNNNNNTGVGAGATSGRRRPKAGGAQSQSVGGLGKSIAMLCGSKDTEIEADLGEIRRGNKRRRATAASMAKTSI